jgi:hypothetical protein
MQRRTVFLTAFLVVAAVAGAAVLLGTRPPTNLLRGRPATGSDATTPTGQPSWIATAQSPPTGTEEASASDGAQTSLAPTPTADGSYFGFVTDAALESDGGAILVVDFAEIRPVDEDSPPGGPFELVNPTVESGRVVAAQSATVDVGAADAGTMALEVWLAKRNQRDGLGTTLSRAPYWMDLRNGRVTHLRMQHP